MAFSLKMRHWYLCVSLFLIVNCSKSGANFAEGNAEENPVGIVDKALLCFDDRTIYSNCEEAYQLSESGNINVPLEETDAYCNGPCLEETELLLNCIDGVLSNFLFYNKASVHDVRATISAGCSDTAERGHFDVGSHIQHEYSHAQKIGFSLYTCFYMAMTMIIGGGLLL